MREDTDELALDGRRLEYFFSLLRVKSVLYVKLDVLLFAPFIFK